LDVMGLLMFTMNPYEMCVAQLLSAVVDPSLLCRQVREACKNNKGFYLGSIGGPAAVLAQDNIKKVCVCRGCTSIQYLPMPRHCVPMSGLGCAGV
jgi:tartrate dehydratase beta subunit/fumarate hydratase class I family protein